MTVPDDGRDKACRKVKEFLEIPLTENEGIPDKERRNYLTDLTTGSDTWLVFKYAVKTAFCEESRVNAPVRDTQKFPKPQIKCKENRNG